MVWSRSWMACAWLSCLFGVAHAGETFRLEEPVDDARLRYRDARRRLGKDPAVEQSGTAAAGGLGGIVLPRTPAAWTRAASESFRSIRDYEQTTSEISVGGQKSAVQLGDHLKLVVAQGRQDGIELYSLGGAMTSNELDLLRSPADSLALIALLPSKAVEIGDKWTAPGWAFQMLTALDAVEKGQLTCSLASVEKRVARVKLEGKVEGAALSAVSEITINGFYEYDMDSKCITQCDLTQVEKPQPRSHLAGIRIHRPRATAALGPLKSPDVWASKKVVDAAITEPQPSATLLRFDSPWNIGFEYPRHWHLWKIHDKAAIFRLIDDGNFVAQCDLAPIASAKPLEHLSEADFKRDIRQALGDRIKTMSNGEVLSAPDRRFIYHVAATGIDGERPLTWFFYLIADSSGRRASLSVTIDTQLAESLAGRDRELLTNLRFGPAPASPRTTSR